MEFKKNTNKQTQTTNKHQTKTKPTNKPNKKGQPKKDPQTKKTPNKQNSKKTPKTTTKPNQNHKKLQRDKYGLMCYFYREKKFKYSLTRRQITPFKLSKIIAGTKKYNLLPIKQTTTGEESLNRDDIAMKSTDFSLIKFP